MRVLRLPRNYQFIQRLPKTFTLLVLKEGNKRGDAVWYLVDINGHRLNILSKEKLGAQKRYLIQKRNNLLLAIVLDLPDAQSPNIAEAANNGELIEFDTANDELFAKIERGDALVGLVNGIKKMGSLQAYLAPHGIIFAVHTEKQMNFLLYCHQHNQLWEGFVHIIAVEQNEMAEAQNIAPPNSPTPAEEDLKLLVSSLLESSRFFEKFSYTSAEHISSIVHGLRRYT